VKPRRRDLRALLLLRRQNERRQRLALARAVKEQAELVERRTAIEQALVEADATAQPASPVRPLARAWRDVLRRSEWQLAREQSRAEAMLARVREDLVQARAARRAVELVVEHRAQELARERSRHEQLELEDLAQANRRSSEEQR
jgi:hypothetical protein